MSWIKASVATAAAQAIRMASGLVVLKVVAMALGPEGFGRIGHFMSLIAILSVLGGGAILNGVVKYVAQYRQQPARLATFLSSALLYTLVFSTLLCCAMWVGATPLSVLLFDTEAHAGLIKVLGFVQFSYGLVSFCNGTINGLRETTRFATVIAAGTVLGLPVACYFIVQHGFAGAVLGLALVNALVLVPAVWAFVKLGVWRRAAIRFDAADVRSLSQFSLMQFISLCTLPLAEMYIRNALIHDAGLNAAGIWQSLMRLSAVYVGFFTTFLAAYYMPTLSGITDPRAACRYVFKYIAAIGALFGAVAVVVFLARDLVFALVFSEQFVMAPHHVLYQLLGDLFKIMAYVIAFLVVAKAKTWLYIGGELLQSCAYLGVALTLLRHGGTDHIYAAYAVSNLMYFLVCLSGLLIYYRRARLAAPRSHGLPT